MKNRIMLFILIAVLVAIPISLFMLFLNQTRSIPDVRVELHIDTSKDKDSFAISSDSLKELNSIIEKNSVKTNEERIIEIFDRERNKYIALITIISVLLTVFSLFSIVTGMIDKNDYKSLKSEMEKQINDFSTELKEIKWKNLIMDFDSVVDALREKNVLLLENNEKVNTYKKLAKYIEMRFKYYLQEIQKNCYVMKDEKLDQFSINTYNLITASQVYAVEKKYIKKTSYKGDDNIILQEIERQLSYCFDNDICCLIKNKINEIGVIAITFSCK
jgi:hypothetical protein